MQLDTEKIRQIIVEVSDEAVEIDFLTDDEKCITIAFLVEDIDLCVSGNCKAYRSKIFNYENKIK